MHATDSGGFVAVNQSGRLLGGATIIVVAFLFGRYAILDWESRDVRSDAQFSTDMYPVERDLPIMQVSENQNVDVPATVDSVLMEEAIPKNESKTEEAILGIRVPEEDDSLPVRIVGEFKDPEDQYETPKERMTVGRFKDPERQ